MLFLPMCRQITLGQLPGISRTAAQLPRQADEGLMMGGMDGWDEGAR
jgi:hypothetical protein